MGRIRQHFEHEAEEFDRIIVKLIPDYPQMVEALVAALPFGASDSVRFVDLGCGTGTVARCILDRFPNAQATCLDTAGNMIGMARTKLADYPRVRYVTGDFDLFDREGKHDAVVSSLALHHLTSDEEKRIFYRRIFLNLNPGGSFYNADVVLGSSDFLQSLYMEQWRAYMRRSVSAKEIEENWIPKYEAEDRPARLTDQLAWLDEIGFAGVDVLWKRINFAVYGGRRP